MNNLLPRSRRLALALFCMVELGSMRADASATEASSISQIQRSNFCLLGFELGASTLRNVVDKLGTAQPLPSPEGGPTRHCYLSHPRGSAVVVFESGAAGGWATLTSFSITQRQDFSGDLSLCRQSRAIPDEVATRSGIRLGATPQQIRKAFGAPTEILDGSWRYELLGKRPMTESEKTEASKLSPQSVVQNPYIDISVFVQARFGKTGLASITVTKLETY